MRIYNVQVEGEGSQPILFAHGLACDQHVWHKIWPSFSREYQVILFDFIGSGNSDLSCYCPERYATLEGYSSDILDICEALKLTDVIFVGHSVSCIAGMLAAIRNPSIFSRLIMIGPSPYYINEPGYYGGFDKDTIGQLLKLMKEDYLKWTRYFAPTVMGNPDTPGLTEELQEIFCKADPHITAEFAEVTFYSDNRSDLARVEVPSLILQASKDVVAPKHIGEYMHNHMPESALYHLRATGHCPHLSAPDEIIAVIKQYLQGTLKAGTHSSATA